MNGAKYGKGDRPRNNWGPKWEAGYAAIDWHRRSDRPTRQKSPGHFAPPELACHNAAGIRRNQA